MIWERVPRNGANFSYNGDLDLTPVSNALGIFFRSVCPVLVVEQKFNFFYWDHHESCSVQRIVRFKRRGAKGK